MKIRQPVLEYVALWKDFLCLLDVNKIRTIIQ